MQYIVVGRTTESPVDGEGLEGFGLFLIRDVYYILLREWHSFSSTDGDVADFMLVSALVEIECLLHVRYLMFKVKTCPVV